MQANTKASSTYDPKPFWENRLSSSFNLCGVGHASFSESYNRWLYRKKKRCIESYFKGVSLEGKDVLDVGCGTGFFIDWFLHQGAKVCGMDLTEVSIRKLRQSYDCEFMVQDITAADYQPLRKVDVVNMWDVIYHIVEPLAFERALDNIAQSLKQNGLFLFTDDFGAPADASEGKHVQKRCLDTYQRILPQRGFELVTVTPLYCVLNKRRLPGFDNYLGGFYFMLDSLFRVIPQKNLSLGVWRYR